jgi:hypothetical protein
MVKNPEGTDSRMTVYLTSNQTGRLADSSLVVRQSPAGKNVSAEAREPPLGND